METTQIGGRLVGRGQPCFIIAEIGTNHDQSLAQAKALVKAAHETGADAVKFQIYEAGDIVSNAIMPSDYGLEDTYPGITMFEAFHRHLRTPREWFPELSDYAMALGIIPLATAHSGTGAAFIDEMGMAAVKIASMDLNNLPLLSDVTRATKLPVIVSTGIASLAEIDDAVSLLARAGHPHALLHCVANYPAAAAEMRLQNIPVLLQAYAVPIGFSDHSLSAVSSIAATTLGACIIEKHITLNRAGRGPDHPFALEPQDFKALVAAIREVEAAYRPSTGFTPPLERERKKRQLYRRSLVSARAIAKGQRIEREDIKITRPGTGLAPRHLEDVIGLRAAQDIAPETPLTWEML